MTYGQIPKQWRNSSTWSPTPTRHEGCGYNNNNNGSPMDYGNPLTTSAGTSPWADGTAWGGSTEPKATANANCVATVRNSQTAGAWASVPCGSVDQTVTGGYVCKQLSKLKVPAKTTCAQAGWVGLNGRCYKAFTASVTQPDAKTACQQMGASLVKIPSQEVNIFVKGLIARVNTDPTDAPNFTRFHIGMMLTRDPATNKIISAIWPDGSTVTYGSPTVAGFVQGTPPWATGASWNGGVEPKTQAGADCVSIVKNSLNAGDWVASPCTVNSAGYVAIGGYVCEKGTA